MTWSHVTLGPGASLFLVIENPHVIVIVIVPAIVHDVNWEFLNISVAVCPSSVLLASSMFRWNPISPFWATPLSSSEYLVSSTKRSLQPSRLSSVSRHLVS